MVPKLKSMYSQQFIDEVKELFPDSPKMHEMAESGEYFLGRYLDDSSQGGMAIDTILLATSLEELQKEARIIKRKRNLYGKWAEESRK